MPKVTHISTGVTVSVSDRRAEALDASAWRRADVTPAKPKRKRTTKPKAAEPEAPAE